MTTSACVRRILATLSRPVLNALNNAITLLLTEIDTQIAALTAKLAVLDVTLAPVQAARAAALEVIDTAQLPLRLLPTNLVRGCAELGDVKQTIADATATATAKVEEIANDATRLLAVRAKVQALVDKLTKQREQIVALQADINEALSV